MKSLFFYHIILLAWKNTLKVRLQKVIFYTIPSMKRLFLLLALACNSSANILMKLWSKNGFVVSQTIWQTIHNNWYILVWGFLFWLNMIFYILALKNINLSLAYPIMIGLKLTITSTFSFLYLNETFWTTQLIWYILIYAWIILLFFKS